MRQQADTMKGTAGRCDEPADDAAAEDQDDQAAGRISGAISPYCSNDVMAGKVVFN